MNFGLATITEIDAADGDSQRALDASKSSGATREGDAAVTHHHLLATLGATDFVAVSIFDALVHLDQATETRARVLRRSTGVLCPPVEPAFEPGVDGVELVGLEQALAADVSLPFVAVTYLELSPLAALFVPTAAEDEPIAGRAPFLLDLFHRLMTAHRIWSVWDDVLTATLGQQRRGTRLRVAPLIGLDRAPLVLVSAADRLESFSALAWAIRQQCTKAWWPAVDHPSALERVRAVMGPRPDLAEAWDASPAFRSASSIIGMHTDLLRDPAVRAAFRRDKRDAARDGVFTERRTFVTGSPHRVQPAPTSDAVLAHPTQRTPDSLLMLVGGSAVLSPHRPLCERRIGVSELADHLGGAAAHAGSPDAEPSGVETITELAVRVELPRGAREGLPRGALLGAFTERLRAVARRDRERGALASPAGLTQRWLRAARDIGLVHPATDGLVNLIAAVTSYAQQDIEASIDVLAALDAVVRFAEATAERFRAARRKGAGRRALDATDGAAAVRQLRWMCGAVERLADARARHDHPLRPPRATLAFEGSAGARIWRDAFAAFVERLAEQAGCDDFVLVHDAAGGGIECRPGPLHGLEVSVSASVLHHPVHWACLHAIGHGLATHGRMTLRGAPRAAYEAWCAARDRPLRDGDTVDGLVEAAVERLRAMAPTAAPTAAAAVQDVLPQIWADLILWAGTRANGPADADDVPAAFWLLFGVSLCHSAGEQRGNGPMGHRDVVGVVLRVVLLSLLTDADAPEVFDGAQLTSWLQELATWLWAHRAACRRGAEVIVHAPDAWHERLIRRLIAVKLDLWVPDRTFEAATTQLVSELRVAIEEGPAAARWSHELAQVLVLLRALARDHVFGEPAPEPLRLAFQRYLRDLVKLMPAGSPWPRHVRGVHPRRRARLPWRAAAAEADDLALSRRGGVVSARASAYAQRTLDFALEMDQLARRHRFDKVQAYLEADPR